MALEEAIRIMTTDADFLYNTELMIDYYEQHDFATKYMATREEFKDKQEKETELFEKSPEQTQMYEYLKWRKTKPFDERTPKIDFSRI